MRAWAAAETLCPHSWGGGVSGSFPLYTPRRLFSRHPKLSCLSLTLACFSSMFPVSVDGTVIHSAT